MSNIPHSREFGGYKKRKNSGLIKLKKSSGSAASRSAYRRTNNHVKIIIWIALGIFLLVCVLTLLQWHWTALLVTTIASFIMGRVSCKNA